MPVMTLADKKAAAAASNARAAQGQLALHNAAQARALMAPPQSRMQMAAQPSGPTAMGALASQRADAMKMAAAAQQMQQDKKLSAAQKNAVSQMQPPTSAGMAFGPGGFAKGGSVSGASSRADGCAQRGKTKGRYI